MAELADAPDLGSGVNRRAGSTPVIRIAKSATNPYFVALFCVKKWYIFGTIRILNKKIIVFYTVLSIVKNTLLWYTILVRYI